MNTSLALVNPPSGFRQVPAHDGIAALLANAQDEVIAMSTLAPTGPAWQGPVSPSGRCRRSR